MIKISENITTQTIKIFRFFLVRCCFFHNAIRRSKMNRLSQLTTSLLLIRTSGKLYPCRIGQVILGTPADMIPYLTHSAAGVCSPSHPGGEIAIRKSINNLGDLSINSHDLSKFLKLYIQFTRCSTLRIVKPAF